MPKYRTFSGSYLLARARFIAKWTLMSQDFDIAPFLRKYHLIKRCSNRILDISIFAKNASCPWPTEAWASASVFIAYMTQ